MIRREARDVEVFQQERPPANADGPRSLGGRLSEDSRIRMARDMVKDCFGFEGRSARGAPLCFFPCIATTRIESGQAIAGIASNEHDKGGPG